MSDLASAVKSQALSELQAGIAWLEGQAEAKSPIGLDLLEKMVLNAPPVQGWISEGEEWLADHASVFVASKVQHLKDWAQGELKAHPGLASLWAAIKPKEPVALPQAKFEDDVWDAILRAQADGTLRAKVMK